MWPSNDVMAEVHRKPQNTRLGNWEICEKSVGFVEVLQCKICLAYQTPTFGPKTNNQPLKKFLSLAFS